MQRPHVPLFDVALDAEAYGVDFALAERYQGFSTEVVRLALLGIAGYGFMFATLLTTGDTSIPHAFRMLPSFRVSLGCGLVAFGLATGTALAHRYYSTDCLTHHVTLLRLLKKQSSIHPSPESEGELRIRMASEQTKLRSDLRLSGVLLVASISLLFLGAAAVAFTFFGVVTAL
jgi:hypothetical protein